MFPSTRESYITPKGRSLLSTTLFVNARYSNHKSWSPTSMANVLPVVSEVAVTDNYYAWFVKKGTVTLTTAAAEAPTAGEYVKWATGVTTIADDGAARTANSIGYAKANIAAATAGSVYLFGDNATQACQSAGQLQSTLGHVLGNRGVKSGHCAVVCTTRGGRLVGPYGNGLTNIVHKLSHIPLFLCEASFVVCSV